MKSNLITQFKRKHLARGQSFVELALILPILLFLLLGVVEIAFYVGRYLDVLDLTREAARFASLRDPFPPEGFPMNMKIGDENCQTEEAFNFYYDTACVFSPPGSTKHVCNDPAFCGGLNTAFEWNSALDDVVISVYTVSNASVTDTWPKSGGGYVTNKWWALSDYDSDTAHNSNWKYDCKGNEVRTLPNFGDEALDFNPFLQSSASPKRGFVVIEVYHCYEQALNLPLFSDILPNPAKIHAYTVMSLPAAAPTTTPLPSP